MKLLSRADWGASYDVDQRPPMSLPVAHAFIHHTVTVPTTDPAHDMRTIEQIDIGRFGYPSYSWVIHPTGTVLEGMATHIGAHTIHNNSTSFGISFIGNFENDTPTPAALEACVTLLAARIAQGHLTGDFELFGHRDVYATACPGSNLYPLIGQIRANVNTPPPEDDMANAKGPFMVRFGNDGAVHCITAEGHFHVVDEAHRDRMKLFGLVQTDPSWENGCVQVHPENQRADILFGRDLDA